MANADPYQYALRQAMDSGGRDEELAVLRQSVEELCTALREEGVSPEKATESLVRTASDLLLSEVRKARTHDLAQQIIDDVERWCASCVGSAL